MKYSIIPALFAIYTAQVHCAPAATGIEHHPAAEAIAIASSIQRRNDVNFARSGSSGIRCDEPRCKPPHASKREVGVAADFLSVNEQVSNQPAQKRSPDDGDLGGNDGPGGKGGPITYPRFKRSPDDGDLVGNDGPGGKGGRITFPRRKRNEYENERAASTLESEIEKRTTDDGAPFKGEDKPGHKA